MDMEKIVVKIEPDLLLEHLESGVTNDSEPLAEFEEKMGILPNVSPPTPPSDLENGALADASESSSEFKIFKTPKKERKEIQDHDSESNRVKIKDEIEEKYTPPSLSLDPVLFCEPVLSSTKNQKATKPVKCPECRMEFPKNINLQKHMRAAHQNKFPCSLCQKVYVEKARLRLHKLRVHNINDKETEEIIPATKTPEKLKCFKCDLTFTTSFRLQNHEYSAHPIKKEFKCSTCDLKFSSEKIQILHENFTHPKKLDSNVIKTESISPPPPLPNLEDKPEEVKDVRKHVPRVRCPKCNQKFKSKSDMIVHQKLKPECDKHTCTTCFYSFSSSVGLHNHNRKHPETYIPKHKANFKCSKCDQTLKTIRDLSIHEKQHGDKFPCQLCPGVFEYKNFVLIHREKAHPECQEKYEYEFKGTEEEQRGASDECISCPKMFDSPAEHKKAMGKHWHCDLCSAIFESVHGMRTHRGNVHPEYNQFKCFKCGIAFATRHIRVKHMKMHKKMETKVRFTAKCSKCVRRFPTLKEKTEHEEECHKPKVKKEAFKPKYQTPTTIKCNHCSNVFASKTRLLTHQMRIHPSKVNKLKQKQPDLEEKISDFVVTSEPISESIGLIKSEEVLLMPDEDVKQEFIPNQLVPDDPILGF